MSAGDKDSGDPREGGADPPLTVELLADLQAGLLDDDTAARVRRQVRADPDAAATLRALNRVRSDVGAVGADPASAPDAPPAVAARISAALRSASSSSTVGAAHSARPRVRPARLIAGVAGAGAVVAAIGLGTAAVVNAPTPTPSTQETAEHITVSGPPSEPTIMVPLSQAQILGLLHRSPDYGPPAGPLNDPARRAACLSGLGYPASTRVLGAQPVDINTRPGILLVLPGDTPDNLVVFAVTLNCNAADTGLLVSTQIPRA